MTYNLINSKASPFGRKVAIALREKRIPYTVQYDIPWNEDSITSKYSPLAQLPILITETGEIIYESGYILEWLEARHPSPPLLPITTDERLEARKRQMLGECLQDFGGILMFELGRDHPSQAWFDRYEKKVINILALLEEMYSGSNSRKLPVDLGDISIVSTLDIFSYATSAESSIRIVDTLKWYGKYPALTQLSDDMNMRESFSATQPGHMDVDMKKVTS